MMKSDTRKKTAAIINHNSSFVKSLAMHKICIALNKEKHFDVNDLSVNDQPLLLSSRNPFQNHGLTNSYGLRTSLIYAYRSLRK